MRMTKFTRRQSLVSAGSLIVGSAAGSALGRGQVLDQPLDRLAPRDELVNVLELEDMAKLKLPSSVYASVAGSDRRAFDRMTFRPRRMVYAMDLDLTTEIFGDQMFAPILLGPVSEQRRFHPQGELETARGASAAKTAMVVSNRSSYPIGEIATHLNTAFWYQVYADEDFTVVRRQVQGAVDAGCKAVCITVGGPLQGTSVNASIDWRLIDQLRQGIDVPVLIKGIMTPEDADTAIQRGAQGIVVSNHGRALHARDAAPIEQLPSIVDAVAGRAPVLMDGSVRRGTDILKALTLGAWAVLLGRPPIWGLAAYGAEGVQTVIELIRLELARTMAASGGPTIESLGRWLVRIHSR